MINIPEKYIKICIHCMIYTFLVYIHMMCFHIMTQEEKKYCGFYHYCWMYFVFANTHLFFLPRFTKIYTSVYFMTILGKLSCLQEAFIYIIVQTLKEKMHNCHSWVIVEIFFTWREFHSSLFSSPRSEILWAAFLLICYLHNVISSNLSNFYFVFDFGEKSMYSIWEIREKKSHAVFPLSVFRPKEIALMTRQIFMSPTHMMLTHMTTLAACCLEYLHLQLEIIWLGENVRQANGVHVAHP